MKNLALFGALLLSSNVALAGIAADKAIKVFNANADVKKEITDLKAKRVGQPTAIQISAMGDGCDYMESYLIVQAIKPTSDFFAQRTVSARVDVNTADLDCGGEGKGKRVNAIFGKTIDLGTATRDE